MKAYWILAVLIALTGCASTQQRVEQENAELKNSLKSVTDENNRLTKENSTLNDNAKNVKSKSAVVVNDMGNRIVAGVVLRVSSPLAVLLPWLSPVSAVIDIDRYCSLLDDTVKLRSIIGISEDDSLKKYAHKTCVMVKSYK